MIKIDIFKKQENFSRIVCDGHAGFGVYGEDIVCSAVSSIVQTAALGLLMVACAKVTINRDDEKGFFEIIIPENLSESTMHDVNIILSTMLCGLSDLREEYSDFIELEVQNVY